MPTNNMFGTGFGGWNNQQMSTPTKQQKFPGLSADQIKRLESLTSDPTEQQKLYQQAIQQLNRENVNDSRMATENEITYKSLNEKDVKQQNYMQSNVRLEQLADLTKNKFGLNANANTQDVVNGLLQYAEDSGVSLDSLNKYLSDGDETFLYQMGLKERPAQQEKTFGQKVGQVGTDIVGGAYDSATSLPRMAAKGIASAIGWTAKQLGADEQKTDALVQSYKDYLDNDMSSKDIGADQESAAYNISKGVGDLAQVVAGEGAIKGAVQGTAKGGQLLNYLKNAPTWQKIVAGGLEGAGDMTLYSIVSENKLPTVGEAGIGAAIGAAIPGGGALYKAVKPAVKKGVSKAAAKLELSGLLNPAKLNTIKNQLVNEGVDIAKSGLKGGKAEDVGTWMIERGFKGDKPTIINDLGDYAKKSHNLKREVLGASDTLHSVESANKSLEVIQKTIQDVPGLEQKLARVEELMAKDKHTLSELDEVKSILDDTVDLYTNVGDVRAGANKKGLDLVRKDLKKYIEDAAEKEGLGNIKMLNNETQIAKGLQDAISRKDSADAAREMLSVFSKGAIGGAAGYNVGPFDNHTLAGKIGNIAVGALAGRYLFSTKAKTQFASLINKMSGGAKKELERLVAGDLAVKNLSKNTQKELASVFEKSGIIEIGATKELNPTEYEALIKKYSNSDLPALEVKEGVSNPIKDLSQVRERAYKNVESVMEEAKASGLEPGTAEYDKVVGEKLYKEFEDSFDDLLAEHMSNPEKEAHLIDPDELRYLVNNDQKLPAGVTHPIVKELADRQYKKVVDELMKTGKKNALVMGGGSGAGKGFVRSNYKLAEKGFQDGRTADIIVDKVSGVEEANELVKKGFDVQQYGVIPRAENVVLNIAQRAYEKGRGLSIPKVGREAHLRFVDQFLNGRPKKGAISPLELYANSLKGDGKYQLKLLGLKDNLVEVPNGKGFTKYVPEAGGKGAVEIPMSEWRKALEDYEKEIGVELSNEKIEKVVKERFLDTGKIDKSRYKELVTGISGLLLLGLANLGLQKEEA